ncbi:hypothetical protein K432DRAFT_306726 [Lepidopterella palustris CBS 459.81]|uniref:BHLH domain-containing protein n=1 Tax=Lepidopterella palustris CBS 459.81 TaxID=1314670 RepID=A0A8E2JBU1_9PEZI|nr:hypothetical protein K432DRAFT_306726 [Lepidopterella palustris CBS 459.81]
MPRPAFPPTPAPSTDISGKPNNNAAQFDSTFALPPAALSSGRGSSSSSSAASNASDTSYQPISPTSPATSKTSSISRKRPSTSQSIITKDDYTLPPPPTRSRKIIQMKPRAQELQESTKGQTTTLTSTKPVVPATGTGSKKKQSNGTTAAGRKIARKTAHSLIERRRRSKMNEEFGVLKDMIPACSGQEMHKLAILQASIEYMRYLEQCVADLKASHRSRRLSATPTSPPQSKPIAPHNADIDEEDERNEDEEMSDAVSPTHVPHHMPDNQAQVALSAATSPAIYPSDHNPYSTNASPTLHPSDGRRYSLTTSPALQPSDLHHYSLTSSILSTATSPSIHPSPAFSAQSQSTSQFRNPFTGSVSGKGSTAGAPNFTLTSPALGPQPDDRDREDHEATEALLMLNMDRRSWSGRGRGMSVKDLLSG